MIASITNHPHSKRKTIAPPKSTNNPGTIAISSTCGMSDGPALPREFHSDRHRTAAHITQRRKNGTLSSAIARRKTPSASAIGHPIFSPLRHRKSWSTAGFV